MRNHQQPRFNLTVDLVLTDPPYGLGKRLAGGTWGNHESWDNQISEIIPSLVVDRPSIIWGGQYYQLPVNRGWLVWYKRDSATSMSDAELAWTNLDINTHVFDYPIAAVNAERVGHPTQKPIALMAWCIQHSKTTGLILDPFMGSGTTLVAAKKLNRYSIGIEISEKYCEIAAKRLMQEVMVFDLPTQSTEKQVELKI
jgi:DNA modification methylase